MDSLLGRKITKAVKVIGLSALFFFSGYHYPAQARLSCGPVSVIYLSLMDEGYSFFSTAAQSEGLAVSLFLDQNNNWRIVGIDNDLNACVIMSGVDWKFLTGRRI